MHTIKLTFKKIDAPASQAFFSDDIARQLTKHLSEEVSFTNAFTQNGQSATASNQEINSWSRDKQKEFGRALYADASRGVGFYYGRHAVDKNAQPDSLLNQVFHFLNAQSTLDKIKQITGENDIVCASAQATRYIPGNYLTRHNDLHPVEQRRVAYVLNFTESWHPDWGGNLQFYQQDGTPRDAWAPQFNSMTLFDVNHVHSVTFVAPFALKPRLAVTGWFRATPL